MYGGMNGKRFDVNRLRDGGRRGDDDYHGGVNLFYSVCSQEQVFWGYFSALLTD